MAEMVDAHLGPATDSHNEPVIDPTKNVIDLVRAADKRSDDMVHLHVQRIDDLREASQHRQDNLREMADTQLHELGRVRAEYDKQLREEERQQQRRKDDMRGQESAHVRELLKQQSEYEEKLRNAETKRIDAIRAVDVKAVEEASKVSAAQALILATQVAASAETLRTQVTAVAAATATALSNALEPLQKAIEDLRKTQYEAQGVRAAGVDQRSDRRDDRNITQWAVGLAVTVVLIAVQVFLHYAPIK